MDILEEFESMIGKTMADVVSTADTMVFTSTDGKKFTFYHSQDCCESVGIDDINGNLKDLVGEPILQAEQVSHEDPGKPAEYADSWTWTFYKFATVKGSVTVRWLGESNGYYSESVNFSED